MEKKVLTVWSSTPKSQNQSRPALSECCRLKEIIKNRDKKIQEQSDLIKKLEDYIAILEKKG